MLSRGLRQRLALRLARWLGPWTQAEALPRGVSRSPLRFAAVDRAAGPPRAFHLTQGYRYAPVAAQPSGCYVVVPGLHFAGPDDPRMDRFCRVLASCGIVVFAPYIRCFQRLVVGADARDDVAAALVHAAAYCRRSRLPRPGVFSISFGCYPAVSVAADPQYRDALGSLVLFGGFANFAACIRFAVSKRAFMQQRPLWLPHDPLNTPAVMINLLPHIEVPAEPADLAAALLELARATWGRPQLRPSQRREPIAADIAKRLIHAQRELFYVGAGLRPGVAALTEVALGQAPAAFSFTEMMKWLGRVRAPVIIAHGRDDDVIPYAEAFKLRDALPPDHPQQLLLTGLFGHTGSEVPRASQLATELRTLRQLLFAMIDGAHDAV